jgi:hypothetical protein
MSGSASDEKQDGQQWQVTGGIAFNPKTDIRLSRRGYSTLRYEERGRFLDLTLESNHPLVSVYLDEVNVRAPTGEPFTTAERAIVKAQL